MKRYVLKPVEEGEKLGLGVEFEKELNSEQLAVVQNADGPALVLAGAGSGKTRTLIYRVLYLLDKGVLPQNILLVTFTNKAAFEMKNRVERALGTGLKGLWCGTFHHMGLRILRQYSKEAGLGDSFTILDQEDSRDLIKSCYNVLPFKAAEVRFPQASVLQKIISFAVNSQRSITEVIDSMYTYFSHFEKEISLIAAEYDRKKAATNNLDFDDLIQKWISLMKEHPQVHEKLSQQFKYCMVDEYQDINPLQNKVMELLSSFHKNLLVVGDDAQSIYSFRGAEIKNILAFPQRYPQTKMFKLETNYRSTPEILSLANGSIANNVHQYEKELRSVKDPFGRPQLVRVRDPRDQSRFVAQRILELNEEGVPLDAIAVLFRARYQAAELELELSKKKINYVLRGGVRFFEQAHIKDVVAYLKIIENPQDEIPWQRALNLYPGIGPGTSKKLHEIALSAIASGKGIAYLGSSEFVGQSPKRAKVGVEDFSALMKRIVASGQSEKPDLLITKILDAGYAKNLRARFDNAKDREDDLNELANFAHTYDNVTDFLNDLALRENFRGESFDRAAQQSLDTDGPLVLSTIHQAKGLEWKAVIVLSLAEGQFPHHQAKGDAKALEEERRLFYVAVTRAEQELYLMHPMTRFDREAGTVLARVSPFIEELPEHSYEATEVIEESQANRWMDEEETIFIDE